MAGRTPSGELHFMVGDFPGYGLSATLGVIPASEVFYRMTASGHGLKAIIEEMNKKLVRLFPPDIFCSACFFRIDPIERSLLIWNGGVPDVLLYSPRKGLHRRFTSRHLPLGVLRPDAFDVTLEAVGLEPDEGCRCGEVGGVWER